MLQAAVEEAEQELVGQTGGAVTMLSILCLDQQKDKNTQKESRAVKVNYSKKNGAFNWRCERTAGVEYLY